MSDQVPHMTSPQIWLGIVRIAAALTVSIFMLAFILSWAATDDSLIGSITINGLLIAVAVSFLVHAFLALLKIIDWFEARRTKRVVQ